MKKNENDEPFDSWEQLFAVYDDVEPNPEIPHRVIEKMRRNELKSSRRAKARRVWKFVASGAVACGLCPAVVLPVTLSSQKPIIYDTNKVTMVMVDDLNVFQQENNLSFLFYEQGSLYNYIASAEGKLAFVYQGCFLLRDEKLEQVSLYAVLMPNAVFEFQNGFKNLNKSESVGDIKLRYSESKSETGFTYKAEFSYEQYTYYLQIDSSDQSPTAIEYYVNLLLN